MPSTRTIQVDQDVWEALQSRARPFEDTPNSVLRTILGLPKDFHKGNILREDEKMDDRVEQLLSLLNEFGEGRFSTRSTRSSIAVMNEKRKTIGYLYPQKRRLKFETRRDWAEAIGATDWDHELPNGWFNTGISSVYWYINDDEQYRRVSQIIGKLSY